MIQALQPEHSIGALIKRLGIKRSTFYYKPKPKKNEALLEYRIRRIFRKSRKVYGRLKIQEGLYRLGYKVSPKKIGKIMDKYGLISKYTLRRKKKSNKPDVIENALNMVNRKFYSSKLFEKLYSDTTYIKLSQKWCYLVPILDISNREIVGSSIGKNKKSVNVKSALYSIEGDLRKIDLLHNDRGSEFTANEVVELLKAFGIKHSFSAKGNPIDNAPLESLINIIKTEFIYGSEFKDFEDLQKQWAEYVEWYNNERFHGSLGYQTPKERKEELLRASGSNKNHLKIEGDNV